MANFFLTIDASSAYSADAPLLEILINGSVVSSLSITSGFSAQSLQLSFNGNKPSSLSFRFNDGSGEGGRSITLNKVLVNGINIQDTNLTSLTLLQNETSDVNITNTDYLYGRLQPTIAELGAPTIEGTNGNDRYYGTADDDIMRGLNGNDKFIAGDGDDRLIGDNGNDHLIGEGGNDLIWGGRHNDRLEGGAGDDLIFGHNDNDYLSGGTGQDMLHAGSGNDRAYGGDGDDIVLGWSGNDRIFGDAGNDRLEGGSGNDYLYGGTGVDRLYGSSGFDILYGNGGNDYLNGGGDADRLYGGSGEDDLRGGNQDDWLYGEAGEDDLRGGNHNDFLHGGADRDILRGDSGNDVLIYDNQDVFFGGSGFDWVVMFRGDTSDLDFSVGRFRTGIEGISLENWNGAAEANNLNIEIADIIANSDLDYVFVAGDNGLDTVTSTDFNIGDRVAGEVNRGGRTYAQLDGGATDLYVEIGLDLNGTTIV